MDDEVYMQRCLQLALLGTGNVAPNPMVGAVLVNEGKIIGEGFHKKYGEAHAEVNCINSIPAELVNLIPFSTLYVSLEPCNHTGHTGPCTDFIIGNNMKKVVVACRDSYEKVNGTGLEKLKSAGIKVIEGILEKEALFLNRRFFTFHKKQRPYIILKWAQTSNGFMGSNDDHRLKISNKLTDRLVHRWRTEEAAITVGTNTARLDNPLLTARYWPGRNPIRIVIDRHLKLSPQLNIFNKDATTIIINTIKNEEEDNLLYYKTSEEENLLAVIINLMHQRQLTSLIVEGGKELLESFIKEDLWDEARIIIAKKMAISNGIKAPLLTNAMIDRCEKLDEDEIQYFIHNVAEEKTAAITR
ncbi:MAG: bifunctional diaminohydroxyphosphoribosylaminopyrimidine deaminase/5-amino-6-(5-phosphoribosylamino)uracil reductase RibD [Ferruginibacter sp.]